MCQGVPLGVRVVKALPCAMCAGTCAGGKGFSLEDVGKVSSRAREAFSVFAIDARYCDRCRCDRPEETAPLWVLLRDWPCGLFARPSSPSDRTAPRGFWV